MMQGADRIKVTILEQKDSQSQYNGVIPGHTNATSNTNVNCAEYGSNVNCNGTTNTHATATPPGVSPTASPVPHCRCSCRMGASPS